MIPDPHNTNAKHTVMPMRVLYVVHDLELAGTERVVADLARCNRETIVSEVVCLDSEGPLADILREEGIAISCTHRHAGIDWQQIPQMMHIIRRFRPDVIHCHQYSPFFYAMLASRFTSHRNIVFTEHGCCIDNPIRPARRLANQIMGRWARAITAVCEHTRTFLVEREGFPHEKIEVIHNGIDERLFRKSDQRAALRAQWHISPSQPIVAQVGTLRPIKDQATCIRAMRAVVDHRADAMLILVGDGPDRSMLESLVNQLHLTDSVRFIGQRSDVADILQACDILVSSSLSEAHSLSLLEAMASGMATIATHVGGNSETIIDGHSGWLVPPGEPKALADAISLAIDDPALRACIAENGRRRLLENFTQRSMHQHYLNVYRRACRREGLA